MKKIISFILAFTCLLGVTGCSSNKEETVRYPEKIKGEFTLYDYEDYGSNFEIIRLSDNFGSLNKSNDNSYAKSGSSSLHIRPAGSKLTPTKPYFMIPTTSERFNFGYEDFSEIYSVKCSIYNASEKNVSLAIGMVLTPDYQTISSYFESFVLKNGWNEVEYVIWNGAQMKGVAGIYFRFDNYACYGQSSPDLYMDDVKLVQKDNINRYVENNPVEDGELCKVNDFSSLQYYSITGFGSKYAPEWVDENELNTIKGDYDGKAIKFTMPIHYFRLQLKPRISREIFLDNIVEGYRKFSFYVAISAENGKPAHFIASSEKTSAYQGNSILNSTENDKTVGELKWQKITIDITEENMYNLYGDKGIELIGCYLSTDYRYDAAGNKTILNVYVGDIQMEK